MFNKAGLDNVRSVRTFQNEKHDAFSCCSFHDALFKRVDQVCAPKYETVYDNKCETVYETVYEDVCTAQFSTIYEKKCETK